MRSNGTDNIGLVTNKTLELEKLERPVPAVGVAYRLAMHEIRLEKHLSRIDSSYFEIGKELMELQKELPKSILLAMVKERFDFSPEFTQELIDNYYETLAI